MAAPASLTPTDLDPHREAMDALCSRWPERRNEVKQLAGLLGAPYDHALPIFVHGPPVTGKSSIVRDVFRTLGRPCAYTSLVDSHGPRLLFDAVVEELAPHLSGLTEKQLRRCDRLADLVSIVTKGLHPDGPAIYIVIDEATRLLDWKGAEPLLPALMKLSELTGRNVGTVLIATPGWDAFRSAAGVRPPVPVFFESYSKAQLQAILLREHPPNADPFLYPNFVASILPLYTSTCKSLHELRALLGPLWRRYVAPWEAARYAKRDGAAGGSGGARGCGDGRSDSTEVRDGEGAGTREEGEGKKLPEPRQLFAILQSGRTSPAFARRGAAGSSGRAGGDGRTAGDGGGGAGEQAKETGTGTETAVDAGGPQGGASKNKRPTGPVLHAGLAVPMSTAALSLARGDWPVPEEAGLGTGRLDFDIPRLTKFMLISAHLATMNRETVDKRLFGHVVEGQRAGSAAASGPGSKRRRGANAADRQQEAAASAALDGPGTFHLERLLAYFRVVTKQAYDEDDAGSDDLARELLSADVFMQISSMVSLGLLTRVSGGDALEGVRFRCDIGNDLARKIAANLRVNLDNYLFYT